MIRFFLICFSFLFAWTARADPFDISENAIFGFGTGEIDSLSNPLIEELGTPGAFQTQSRAVELLGSEFSRAAAQGLVDAQDVPSAPINANVEDTLEGRSNLSVVTGLDRDILTAPNIAPTSAGAICFANRDVDIGSWGDATDHQQLGKLRAKAIAENGEITPKGALTLARFYLALGFGAEAKALASFAKRPKDRDIIIALADILDTGTNNDPTLKGQIFCNGNVSLWAALAQPISPADIPTSTDSILKTFAALPFHLRSHLGPLLAERFRSAGLDEQARHVLNAIVRSGTKTEESALETAKLELSSTQSDQARDQLVELSNGTDVVAARALLELLDNAHSRQSKPQEAWVEDVPSLVRATEGTDISLSLNLAGLRGLISLGRFDDVRLALIEDSPGLTDETRAELAKNALVEATKDASSEVFIRSTIGFSKYFEIESLNRDNRFALAGRLSQLGLMQRAASYLPTPAQTAEERLIASSILSSIGQTPAAIEVLENEALELLPHLATLQAKEGNVSQALATFAEGGQTGTATLLAIQSGNWDWIAENGGDLAADATKALRDPLPSPSAEPINGLLIQQAQTRRQQAARLLKSLETPELSEAFTN